MHTHTDKIPSSKHVAIATDLLKLISDPTRLRILWALLHGEHSVSELAKHVKAQPAAVSQHLAKLRITHLVIVRREGNKMFYQAENKQVRDLIKQALSHARYITSKKTYEQ